MKRILIKSSKNYNTVCGCNRTLVILSFTEPLHGVHIIQNPTLFMKEVGETVEIRCEHDDNTHFYMYWYRQRSLGEMDMITMSVGKGLVQTVEPYNKSKYSMIRPVVQQATLQLKGLDVRDSAVYFCASTSTVF